jgi:hypothetical protein
MTAGVWMVMQRDLIGYMLLKTLLACLARLLDKIKVFPVTIQESRYKLFI